MLGLGWEVEGAAVAEVVVSFAVVVRVCVEPWYPSCERQSKLLKGRLYRELCKGLLQGLLRGY